MLGDHGDIIPNTPETHKTLLITGLTTGRLNLFDGMLLHFRHQKIFNAYVSTAGANKDQEKAQIDYFDKLGDEMASTMNINTFIPGKYADHHERYKFTPEEIKQMNETHLSRTQILIADVRVMTPEIEHDLNFARHSEIPILLVYDDWQKSVASIVRTNSAVRGTILFSDSEGMAVCLKQFLNAFFKIDEMKRLAREKEAQSKD